VAKAHNDRITNDGADKGYSIRVGKTLPQNSANLAYVSTPEMGPTRNLLINDLSGNIKENGLPSTYQTEKTMYPDNTYLLHELSGESKLPSKKVLVTDEFSVPVSSQDVPAPLYYESLAGGLFDARGALVTPYIGGYSEDPADNIVDYAQVDSEEINELLYLGTKIRITNLDGTAINTAYKYKIKLVKSQATGIPDHAYSIYVFSNFHQNNNESFLLHYEKYNNDGTHISDYTEILNAAAVFDEVSEADFDVLTAGGSNLQMKAYCVVETDDNNYQVYSPAQVLIADNTVRPAQQFKYRVKSNMSVQYSKTNPGSINVGIIFLNNSIINVEDLTGSLKKMYEDGSKPAYLEFANPHPEVKSYIKSNPRYWVADIAMPRDQWNDYDLIIITGYGYFDMSPYNDAVRNYMNNGGKIWIDNAGEVGKALTFKSGTKETFLTTVGFSPTTEATGFKAPDVTTKLGQDILNRYYVLGNQTSIALGYSRDETQADGTVKTIGVNPMITFGSGETPNNWTSIIQYSNKQPSVLVSNVRQGTPFEKGQIIVSNCGIVRSLFHNDDVAVRFAMNLILYLAEHRWIFGPWQQDYVYHRDNLFQQEYKGVGGSTIYVDERNDYDQTQIVAKKILKPTTKAALLPYVPSEFFSANGMYEVEVQSDTEIPVNNGSMEAGSYNPNTRSPITSWTATTAAAIPGWDTAFLAGQTPTFRHVNDNSQRGAKAIQVDVPTGGIGSQAYWSNKTGALLPGSYMATAWIKVSNVSGKTTQGAMVAAYNMDGTVITKSAPILGTRDWVRVDCNFSVSTSKQVDLRVGFVDGNGEGIVSIDYLTVVSVGSIYMTPSTTDSPNDGSKTLYAFAVTPRGDSFNLQAEGYSDADVTTYDPLINITYTIRAFVYAWDNNAGVFTKLTGNSVVNTLSIRRSDGIKKIDSMSTILPPLDAGAEWADTNDIYYEVFLGGPDGIDANSQFVNMEIYDTKAGKYYFDKDGNVVVKYMDLFYGGENKNILLQARTNYYTIRAAKRRYGVLVQPENKINLAYPSTIDNRDSWFLRVQNGSFIKKELNYDDIKALMGYDGYYYQFQQRLFGIHYYSLPEFNRQVFKPAMGYKRVREEIAEYINDNTIRVQNYPLYVMKGSERKEMMVKSQSSSKVYKALHGEWDKSFISRVYVDETMNGALVERTTGFDFDYTNGLVIFDVAPVGKVYVDYDYNNLQVWKRSYNNVLVTGEQVISTDKKTFTSAHKNWLAFPTPIIKIVSYNNGEEKIAPVTSYTIDYSSGAVTFKEDVLDRVIVQYMYSTDELLKVRDYDIRNGYIYLEDEIDFRHELYVNYYYEENYLEYRGYFDDAIGTFIALDLNPSEGHYCTMPVVRTDSTTQEVFTSWEPVPTAKLMNKEVYVYIVPHKDSFGNYNEDCVRHCYSLEDWQSVQKTNPAVMLLGVIHLREHTVVQEAVVMDTRQRGGGLKTSIKESQIKKTQPLSKNYWDMTTWDGTAYYKNGVLIIELPKKILQSEGGQFTEKQVTSIVGKYIAYGIYFIVDFV
jgi:hypothetical protein